jgi:hypothetical protein
MRCPRCLLADIPEGMPVCVRCGYAPPGQRGARGAIPAAAAPDERAAREPDARRPEWFRAKRRSGPAPPVLIMDDGDEHDDDDDDRDWAPRRSRRMGARLVAAVGVTLALGSGAVWLNTASMPAPGAGQEAVGPAVATPPVPTPAPPDTGVPRGAPPAPAAPVAAAPSPHPNPSPVARAIPPRRIAHPAPPALLSINAIPWGSVYLDGRPLGNTPQLDRRVAPGSHELRVERPGFQPYQRVIDVAAGQRLRITDITLAER